MKTANSSTSPVVYFPSAHGLIDQCCVCGMIGQLGDFATGMISDVYTLSMKRTTIFLTEDQIKRLQKVATKKGIKPAQQIRMYINVGLAKEKP